MAARLMPFSYVGRMALTNYLMQSVISTTIFYSYGLGLYGRVGPLLDLPLALVIYGLQVPFSRWWLSSHRYGPMEWVWRRYDIRVRRRTLQVAPRPSSPPLSLLESRSASSRRLSRTSFLNGGGGISRIFRASISRAFVAYWSSASGTIAEREVERPKGCRRCWRKPDRPRY